MLTASADDAFHFELSSVAGTDSEAEPVSQFVQQEAEFTIEESVEPEDLTAEVGEAVEDEAVSISEPVVSEEEEPTFELPKDVSAFDALNTPSGEEISAPDEDLPNVFKRAVGMAADDEPVEASYGLESSEPIPSPELTNDHASTIEHERSVDEPVGASAFGEHEEPVAELTEAQAASATEPTPDATETVAKVAESEALPEQYLKDEDGFESRRIKDRRVGDLLLENKLITKRQLDRALERQAETHERIGAILIDMHTISERRLVQVLAMQKDVLPWHLEEDAPTPDALKLVSEDLVPGVPCVAGGGSTRAF